MKRICTFNVNSFIIIVINGITRISIFPVYDNDNCYNGSHDTLDGSNNLFFSFLLLSCRVHMKESAMVYGKAENEYFEQSVYHN